MIIALAARRVDALDAKSARFPSTPESLEIVRQRILKLLQAKRASALVSSAASGADLLALSWQGPSECDASLCCRLSARSSERSR
jgi:hypothetical protein